ncbi:hypothetical protein D3C75_513080 [compost metagenome]
MAPTPRGTMRETTLSPAPSLMPRTPAAVRPMGRTPLKVPLLSVPSVLSPLSLPSSSLPASSSVSTSSLASASATSARPLPSAKRTTLPASEKSMISLLPSVMSTPISSSPSLRLMARIPEESGRLKSDRLVFFTVPLAVAKKTYFSASYSFTGRMAVMRSPSSSGSRLMMGRPRAPRDASGS